MPELPDVEGWRRFLAEHALRRVVRRVTAPGADVLRNTTPQGLGRALSGRRLVNAVRQGKWVWTPSDGPATVVWHFGMTGALVRTGRGEARHEHDRVTLVLDGCEVRLRMARKLGGVWLAHGDGDVTAVTGPLGPDAHGIDLAAFGAALGGRGSVKSALLDQRRLAGAGNLVADEVCWRARVHPERRCASLDDGEVRALHGALQAVLDAAVPCGRVPPRADWLTGARAGSNPVCPRCATPLARGRVAGRTTWWCPTEQSER